MPEQTNTAECLHKAVQEQLYEKYAAAEEQGGEFTWDGPSDWPLWEKQMPKILFLVKEARNGSHPSVPRQAIGSKFAQNILRWSYLIRRAYTHRGEAIDLPSSDLLSDSLDEVAIVEAKKLNEEKPISNAAEILRFALEDRVMLRQQIDLINPHIVVCCNTLECYDAIYEHDYRVEEKLTAEQKCACWKVDNRLVIDFYHPSTPPAWVEVNKRDILYFRILSTMLSNSSVFCHFSW